MYLHWIEYKSTCGEESPLHYKLVIDDRKTNYRTIYTTLKRPAVRLEDEKEGDSERPTKTVLDNLLNEVPLLEGYTTKLLITEIPEQTLQPLYDHKKQNPELKVVVTRTTGGRITAKVWSKSKRRSLLFTFPSSSLPRTLETGTYEMEIVNRIDGKPGAIWQERLYSFARRPANRFTLQLDCQEEYEERKKNEQANKVFLHWIEWKLSGRMNTTTTTTTRRGTGKKYILLAQSCTSSDMQIGGTVRDDRGVQRGRVTNLFITETTLKSIRPLYNHSDDKRLEVVVVSNTSAIAWGDDDTVPLFSFPHELLPSTLEKGRYEVRLNLTIVGNPFF